jgi:hypothetical protein
VWGGCVLLFLAGVIWGMVPDKTGFFVVTNIHELFDMIGAFATVVAAVVAVVALTNWQSQFRHETRFQSLKELKDAATKLHTFRRYLITVQGRCMMLMQSGGIQNQEIDEQEEEARRIWLDALQSYNQAWGTAVAFFTPKEEAAFSGPSPVFVQRSLNDPLRIVMAYANAPDVANSIKFAETCREITDEVRHVCATTVSELEWMLRQNYRS